MNTRNILKVNKDSIEIISIKLYVMTTKRWNHT